MTRRSDALTALVAEVADADTAVEIARQAEEVARRESIAARQSLDNAAMATRDAIARYDTTREALGLIAARDAVGDDTVEALIERARR